ncbi:MAG TPA: metal ABC transporter permease, partial [Thiolapillus brandeum]|nr:metal ABC transporter permease [Thiolapillus brandeum]
MVHARETSSQVHKNRRDLHNLRNMLPFLWEFRGRALFALACLVLSKVANVGVPLVLKQIVDSLENQPGQALV